MCCELKPLPFLATEAGSLRAVELFYCSTNRERRVERKRGTCVTERREVHAKNAYLFFSFVSFVFGSCYLNLLGFDLRCTCTSAFPNKPGTIPSL